MFKFTGKACRSKATVTLRKEFQSPAVAEKFYQDSEDTTSQSQTSDCYVPPHELSLMDTQPSASCPALSSESTSPVSVNTWSTPLVSM